MNSKRGKAVGRKNTRSFVAVPHQLLECENYSTLSASGVKLLLDIFGQFRGFNNGYLVITWEFMKLKGWGSKSTLYRAKNELVAKGFIELTRQGGKNRCSLFAVSWLRIDDCNKKLDYGPTSRPSGNWKGNP